MVAQRSDSMASLSCTRGGHGDSVSVCGKLFPNQEIDDGVHPTVARLLVCGRADDRGLQPLKALDGHLPPRVLVCGKRHVPVGLCAARVIAPAIIRMLSAVLPPIIRKFIGPNAFLPIAGMIVSRISFAPDGAGIAAPPLLR